MRELLSLRRDEAPIIGEVYRHKGDYLKCVADNCSGSEDCENCFFDAESCGFCNGDYGATPRLHFEQVPENELEIAADVKFRHVEEVKVYPPLPGERFIAAVGLVEYVETEDHDHCSCRLCDLTQYECDEAACGVNCHYKRVKQ